MAEHPRHGRLRFSVRGLLAAIAFFAVASAALKFANDLWWAVLSGVAILLFMAMAVVVFVGRGRTRAFAIGFAVCTLTYAAVVYLSGHKELLAYGDGRLPTSKLLTPIYTIVDEVTYIDAFTGQIVSEEVARDAQTANYVGLNTGTMSGGQFGGGSSSFVPGFIGGSGSIAQFSELHRLSDQTFMRIGHTLWALILGVLGGAFATFVYARSEPCDE